MKKWIGLVSRVVSLCVLASLPKVVHAQDKKPEEAIGNYRVEGIDVVQGRVFTKVMRHEFGIQGGYISNNTWTRYELGQVKYAFHFREGLAFEGMFIHAFSQNKQILKELASVPCPSPNSDIDGDGNPDTICGFNLANPPDKAKRIYFGNLVWSPIYGKLALFSKKIFHFDLNISGGVGLFQNERSNRFAFDFGIGTKIFMNEWLAVTFDFKNFIVREAAPFNHIANNRTISLGVSTFLPFHPVHEK